MSGLDIEAIRQRSHLAERLPSGLREHAGRNVAALSDSAADVPVLLAQLERDRAALAEAVASVREQAAEIEQLRTELAGEQREHQVDMREAGAEIRDAEAALADALQVIADLRGGTP